ncbi:MAG: type IX secretion system membrane protein PorP/SprF [Crocinitomicaceae bacterium]|nr:type IX secretion system membrane protein PorP/SprF [Crocinitomicaceae bacterium]
MRRVLLIALLMNSIASFGQQLTQYSQWSWHQFAQNPAHAGIKQCIDIHSLYRIQWVGFEGAPRSGFLTLSVPLNSKRRQFLSARHGLGLKFETDRIAQFSIQRFNVAYAAHFNFNKTDRLSLGLYGGVLQTGYDPNSITTGVADPLLENQGTFFAPDATFGAWYNSQSYYVGAALQNLIPNKWNSITQDSKNRFHAIINGGYLYALNNKFALLPTLQMKFAARGKTAVDLALHLDYQNQFSFGLGFRNADAVMAFAQVKIKEQFSIGYSFDYTISKIQLGAQNTHEVSIRFTTCKPDRKSITGCSLFE